MYQHQPTYQHQRQPSYLSGQPPAKKSRGNPIITRYPPPPGYKGPAQPQGPFGQQPTWQSAPQGIPSQYGVYQQNHYAQQIFPPQQPQAPHPSSMSSWPQSAPPQTWQGHQNGFGVPPDTRRHDSLPFPPSGVLLDGNGDPMPPPDPSASNDDDLEEDFDAECYFARHPEQINPNFSLGLIEWTAPRPARRALPATFAQAELEAIAPSVPKLSDAESISDYFVNVKREEALLSVRQTETWKDIENELIFHEFEAVCSRIVTLSELFDSYRVRFDTAWADADRVSPTPELSRGSTPSMQMDADDRSAPGVLDDLERALLANGRSSQPPSQPPSRANSTSSHHREKITRPKPLPMIRDQKQEDMLAALGVTGSPKLVYQTPGPAFGPPPIARPKSNSQHSRTNSVSSSQGEGQRHSKDDRRNSTHSLLGLDYEPDNDATPRPKFSRNDSSRKRSYADSAAGALDDRILEEDEEDTPRQRKQRRVSDDLNRR